MVTPSPADNNKKDDNHNETASFSRSDPNNKDEEELDDNDNDNDNEDDPLLVSEGALFVEQDENRLDDGREEEEDSFEASIDSFLRGEYDREFAEDAPAPYPGLTPGATIEAILQSVRHMDDPHPSHGAAVLMRFNVPLTRAERWGGGVKVEDPWKEVLRGAITPSMLARRLRASEFSGLLDWKSSDVTEGALLSGKKNTTTRNLVDVVVPSLAFVNAALFFGNGIEPSIVQFTLRRVNGVWLIDKAQVLNKQELFVQEDMEEDSGEDTDYM